MVDSAQIPFERRAVLRSRYDARMAFDPHARVRVAEAMDAPDVDPGELCRALRFIRRINALLGYNRTVCAAIESMLNETTSPQPATLLDVATGSADLLCALDDRNRKRGRSIQMIGIDRHPLTLDEGARITTHRSAIRLLEGDALALPFADRSIDCVVSTMFLHHLSDEDAIAALTEMKRVARHGIVVADLLRNAAAYRWISLFTLFASPMVKHDARASVQHAFSIAEARAIADAAGLKDAKVRTTFAHRFLLTWRRGPSGMHSGSAD